MSDGREDRIIVARHGETEWSRLGRHTGRSDIPLADEGRLQAVALGHRLASWEPVVVLSSPRSRALDTARLAGFAARVEIDDDLSEWDYGALEGRRSVEIRQELPGWTIWAGPVPGGESIEQVAARADRLLGRCRNAGGDSLLFGHGHLLRVLAARWLGQPARLGAHLELGTATVSVLGWERETPVIELWNEIVHRA